VSLSNLFVANEHYCYNTMKSAYKILLINKEKS
jgi:hypothetical protein